MSGTSRYNSSTIALEFIQSAEQLSKQGQYGDAYSALDKAEQYAYGNSSLLDRIEFQRNIVSTTRKKYVEKLEDEANNLFGGERFDAQAARRTLQKLLSEDPSNELGQVLWAELPNRETAERERISVGEFERQLEQIWKKAREFEDTFAGTQAVQEYEKALTEASKKAGDNPDSIPLQHLKREALERRNRAKDKWVGTPTLIADRKGKELVERYESLKADGETAAEFWDESGEFLGRLSIDQCISKAKAMAGVFADQKAQDYLGQAQELLTESPGAAYSKIKDAFALTYLAEFTRDILEEELRNEIEPAIEQRKKATDKLHTALTKTNPEEAWQLLIAVEQMDRYTPGLEDAHQRLLPVMLQLFETLLDDGKRLQDVYTFDAAKVKFQEAIDAAQRFLGYGKDFQDLYPRAKEAFDQCLQAENEALEFDQLLQDTLGQSETDPELANEQLEQLMHRQLSPHFKKKLEHVQVQVDFRLGIATLYNTLEQKMLVAEDEVDLVPIEEATNDAITKYPEEKRFQHLIKRIIVRRLFLKARRLKDDPLKRREARDILQEVISKNGDDIALAQVLIEEITASEERETDIELALERANEALSSGDARLAYLLVEDYRYDVSRQAARIKQIINVALIQWRDETEQQLNRLLMNMDFNLPKVEALIDALRHAQAPQPSIEEWERRVLAPAYANTAKDLEGLGKWEQAAELWQQAFRLAPTDAEITEGRQSFQKQRALLKARVIGDPGEKERTLNDLNNTYINDLTIKRYLAEFYYQEGRYPDARMAVSQALLLSQYAFAPQLTGDVAAIRDLDLLIKKAEEIESLKVKIRSMISGTVKIEDVWEAKNAYIDLLQQFPGNGAEITNWWKEISEEFVEKLESQGLSFTEESDKTWERTELFCEIMILKGSPDIEIKARQALRLTYDQLPEKIKKIVNNSEGMGFGFGPFSDALTNHIEEAKILYGRVASIYRFESIASELGIQATHQPLDLEEILYQLEVVLEMLRSAQQKQREIRGQIITAKVTGEWEPIRDNLRELENMQLNNHRGLQSLVMEVEKAAKERESLISARQKIQTAMAEEEFELIQEQLSLMVQLDDNDEAQFQASLEVYDTYAKLKLKGYKVIHDTVAKKQEVLNRLTSWLESAGKPAEWQTIDEKIKGYSNQGAFSDAIELCQAVADSENQHQKVLEDESWSFGYLVKYLSSPPVNNDEINSFRASALLFQAEEKVKTVTESVQQCNTLVQKLDGNKMRLSQIVSELSQLMEQLQEAQSFWKKFFGTDGLGQVRDRALTLLNEGKQLSCDYPGFQNIENNPVLKR